MQLSPPPPPKKTPSQNQFLFFLQSRFTHQKLMQYAKSYIHTKSYSRPLNQEKSYRFLAFKSKIHVWDTPEEGGSLPAIPA